MLVFHPIDNLSEHLGRFVAYSVADLVAKRDAIGNWLKLRFVQSADVTRSLLVLCHQRYFNLLENRNDNVDGLWIRLGLKFHSFYMDHQQCIHTHLWVGVWKILNFSSTII